MPTLDFPRPLTTVDIVILTLRSNQLHVLLARRPQQADEPYPGLYALPGGFVDIDQDRTLQDCALRKLRAKTGVQTPYLEQVGSWGSIDRDPRGWSATHVYVALLPEVKPDGAEWVAIHNDGVEHELAFDHAMLLHAALERVRSKTEYTSLPAWLLPECFTLSELQQVYEAVLQRPLEKKAFRTRMLAADLLAELDEQKQTGRRPAQLYRLKENSRLVYFSRNFEGKRR